MKFISTIIQSVFLLLMIGVLGLFLVPILPIDQNLELRIVQSGSMEPNIMTGSLVAVWPQSAYQVGDVITFSSPYSKVPTTHRIVDVYEENGHPMFVTKGDANEEADGEPVALAAVKGGVWFSIPRLGYILEFTRQPMGFGFLIVLPACLIILSEIEKIWRELRRRRGTAKNGIKVVLDTADEFPDAVPIAIAKHSYRMMDIATPVRYVELPTLDLRRLTSLGAAIGTSFHRPAYLRTATAAFVFVAMVLASGLLGHTVSYPHDSEESIDNTLGTIALDFTASADGQIYNFTAGGVVGDDGQVMLTILPEANSADMHYDIAALVLGGGSPLCDVLVADSQTPVSYHGPLALLQDNDVLFASPWEISFSVSDHSGLVGGETCDVELTFTAWHVSSDGWGYSDTETVPFSFNYLPTVRLLVTSPALLSVESQIDGEESPEEGETETVTPIVEEQAPAEESTEQGGEEGEIVVEVDPIEAPEEEIETVETPEEETETVEVEEETVLTPETGSAIE